MDPAGFPVNRGTKKMISLERQVRIVAGLLIVAARSWPQRSVHGSLQFPALWEQA